MKKHASSHGLAVLVCTLCSGWLVRMSYEHYPAAMKHLNNITQLAADKFSISWPTSDLSALIIAVLLAMIWGMLFKFIHKD